MYIYICICICIYIYTICHLITSAKKKNESEKGDGVENNQG